MRPLEGIRVLDTSLGPVGGVATAVLADFGADVVKVEPPGGDPFRRLPGSPLWLRGKRSLVVDLKSAAGRRDAHALGAVSDVVVVSGPPSRVRRFGLDADAVLSRARAVVHVSLTGYGPRGPWAEDPAIESLVAARSGRTQIFGRQLRGEAPGFAALPVGQHACAMGAVQGVVAALLRRQRTGHGARVETSLLQGLLPYDLVDLLMAQLLDRGEMDLPDPSAGDQPTLNYQPVLTAEGRWIQCCNLMEHLFYAFLDAIGLLGEMVGDDAFQGSPGAWEPAVVERARDRILLRMQERTADAWMETFRKNGNVAAEPFLTTQQALAHPDLEANGALVTLADPLHGAVRQIGAIAQLSETPARVGAPAPLPDSAAPADAVLREWQDGPAAAFPAATSAPAAPLGGILVVDFSTIIAGPLGASMLADLGARVLKVEPPAGDPSRSILPGGSLAARMNGGKESIAVDLKTDGGRAIAAELVARADVVVHNFRTGVPERLGLGFDACLARNPRLVWAAVRGYGTAGPDAMRPATHPVVGAAMGGAAWQAGPALRRGCESLADVREAARQLMRANEANPDPNTSSVLAAAVLLALFARERSIARGQRIDVSMLVANAWANADDFLAYEGKPPRPPLDDQLRGRGVGERLYATADGWVMLAIANEAGWCRLAEAAKEPALAHPAGRTATRLEAVFSGRTTADWETALGAARVGCVRADGPGPGRFWAEAPASRENDLVFEVEHARHGRTLRWGAIVHVDGPPGHPAAAPLAGEHSDRILHELGHDAAAIAALRADGVVASEAPHPASASASASASSRQ